MRRNCGVLLVLVLVVGTGQVRGDFVTNGGFETGDFTGWTQSGDTSGLFTSLSAPFTGNWGAVLSTSTAMGFLSQTLTTPVGAPLDLSLFLASDGNTPNEFKVTFNGAVLLDQMNLGQQDYTAYKFTVTPTAASNLLEIGFRNDNGFFQLDNVSLNGRGVAAVPEPGSLALLAIGGLFLGCFARRHWLIASCVGI